MRKKKRILSLVLSMCMVFTMTSMPVSATEMAEAEVTDITVSEDTVATPTDAAQVITEFTTLAQEIKEQQLAIGAKEADIVLPDTLQAKVAEAETELTGITWAIDAENSVSDTFDSSENMNGAYYTYKAVIPEEYTLVEGVEVPEIVVLVGENQIVMYGLTAPALVNGVYQIGTADDLYAFAAIVNGTDGFTEDTSANAVLTSDITVNDNVLNEDGTLSGTPGKVWTPIARNVAYSGTFDGDEHIIKGLYVDVESDNVGLFGKNNGTIQNVSVADSYFKGNRNVGGVCGQNDSGSITNCTNSGSVHGTKRVGGVCGYNNSGSITNCTNSGSVNGTNWVGGVCGQNDSGSITNCINSGSVSGSTSVGGVCAENYASITNCISIGSVSGSSDVGGVGGYNGGSITNCYYNSTVYSGNAVGNNNSTVKAVVGKTPDVFKSGEVAYLLNGTWDGTTVTAGVTDGSQPWYQTLGTGGDDYPVLDSKHGTVYQVKKYETCFESGSSTLEYSNTNEPIFEPHTLTETKKAEATCTTEGTEAYWTCSVCKKMFSDEAGTNEINTPIIIPAKGHTYGEPTWIWSEAKDSASATFTCSVDQDTKTIDNATITTDIDNHTKTATVTLDEQKYTNTITVADGFTGTGTTADPYQIDTVADLTAFRDIVNGTNGAAQNTDACAMLTADITVNTGVLREDGTLSDNSSGFQEWTPIGESDSSRYSGTFDGAGYAIHGLYVNASTYGVGLVGYNYGTIQNVNVVDSYFKNTGNQTGSVCGYNNGTIENCTNSGSVNGTYAVGGVCGVNTGSITNCINSGSVNGTQAVGGVSGYNNNGTITNCYYDNEKYTSGGIGGGNAGSAEGKNTTEFASGAVTWLLNGSKSTPAEGETLTWYQNLDNGSTVDAYPVLDSTHGMVYQKDSSTYTNTDPNAVTFEQLTMLITEIETKLDNGTYNESYTTASIKLLKEALVAATKVESTATQEDIKSAYNSLNAAVTNLVTKAFTVTLKAEPATGGKLSGGGSFATGETTQIKAEAATGYRFDGWYEGTDTTGTPLATDAIYDVATRTSDVTYTAKFTQTNSLSIDTVGSGNVALDGTTIITNYRKDVAVGTKITLNATAADGYEFVYWMDGNNRVLSYQAEGYVTYVGMATTIKGVFQKVKASESDVCNYRFLNRNGDLVSSDSAAVNSAVTKPANPSLVGYTFSGWKIQGSADSELIDFTTFKITTNTVFVAVYTKETTTYQVQITGGTISGTEGLITGNYEYDTKLTVVADAAQAGKVFSYWKNSKDEIVSYEESYSFFVGGVMSLTAVFDDKKADAVPIISGVIAKTDNTNKKISFLFDREMPEGYTMIQTGCIATDDNTLGADADSYVLGAAGVDFTKVATSTNGTGQYIWTKGNVSATWYVRGYLTYIDKDGITVTIYTDILTGYLSE